MIKLKYIFKNNWLIVCFLFLLVELFIFPIGEFPLNDDWAYSQSVFKYLHEGKIEFSDMIAIPFISQYLIGIGVCKIFGFSFLALRLISIVATFLMIFVLQKIFEKLLIVKKVQFFILLLFAFNPLVLVLGNTFLPDTLIVFFALISFYFLLGCIDGFQKKNVLLLFLFIGFTIVGTLIRQTGILIPFAFSIVYLFKHPRNLKNCLIAFLPFVVNVIVLKIYEYWALDLHVLPHNYNMQLNGIIDKISHPSLFSLLLIGVNLYTSTICLGLMISPLIFSNWKYHFATIKNSTFLKWVFIFYAFILLMTIILRGYAFPFSGNIFYPSGIGPIIMTGFNSDKMEVVSSISRFFWSIFFVIGGISFFCSFSAILLSSCEFLKEKLNWIPAFFGVLFCSYLIPICFNYSNDRYLILLIPFLFLAYIQSVDFKLNKSLFLIAFIPIFCFSVLGTFDYFAIHKARWKALNYLTKVEKVDPSLIDGGLEFNAWYKTEKSNYIPTHRGRWWWIVKDDYIISPKKRKGYFIKKKFIFNSFFSFSEIYVLKKNSIKQQ